MYEHDQQQYDIELIVENNQQLQKDMIPFEHVQTRCFQGEQLRELRMKYWRDDEFWNKFSQGWNKNHLGNWVN